jgi:hypothetical protein
MPVATATPRQIFFLCLPGLVTLWLLGFFTTQAMDHIPSPFTIEINGKPIATVDESAEDRTQAKLGKDAAVFSLKNSRLQCEGWIMGRSVTENRSYGPKKVSWYKANAENEEQVQHVTAKKEGQAYQLIFTSMFPTLSLVRQVYAYTIPMLKLGTEGALMVDDDDMVLVDLLGGK